MLLRIPRSMHAHVERLAAPGRPLHLLDLAIARYFSDGAPEGYFPDLKADTVEVEYKPPVHLAPDLKRIAAKRKIEEAELVLLSLQRYIAG